MNKVISREHSKTLLPELVEQASLQDTVTVADNGKPILVIVGAEEYARLMEARRPTQVRQAILAEWERKTRAPAWERAVQSFELFSERMAMLDDAELDELLNDAVSSISAQRSDTP